LTLSHALDKAGLTSHSESSPQLYMQAYEIAEDNINDLLANGASSQKPAVLETVERGTFVSVMCQVFLLALIK